MRGAASDGSDIATRLLEGAGTKIATHGADLGHLAHPARARAGVPLRGVDPVVHSDSLSLQLAAVKTGVGVALVPERGTRYSWLPTDLPGCTNTVEQCGTGFADPFRSAARKFRNMIWAVYNQASSGANVRARYYRTDPCENDGSILPRLCTHQGRPRSRVLRRAASRAAHDRLTSRNRQTRG